MEKKEAFALFRELEAITATVEGDPDSDFISDQKGWEEPVFDVRLDAGSGNDIDDHTGRTWRIRVTGPVSQWAPDYVMKQVYDLAEDAGVGVTIANSGLELS